MIEEHLSSGQTRGPWNHKSKTSSADAKWQQGGYNQPLSATSSIMYCYMQRSKVILVPRIRAVTTLKGKKNRAMGKTYSSIILTARYRKTPSLHMYHALRYSSEYSKFKTIFMLPITTVDLWCLVQHIRIIKYWGNRKGSSIFDHPPLNLPWPPSPLEVPPKVPLLLPSPWPSHWMGPHLRHGGASALVTSSGHRSGGMEWHCR